MKSAVLLLASLLSLASHWASAGEDSAGMQTYTRPSQSLNGDWKIIVDPYENGYYNYRYQAFDQMDQPPKSAYFVDAEWGEGQRRTEYDFDRSESLKVPGDWNTQKDKLYYYEGSLWYRKRFDAPEHGEDERVFVHFGAANYEADVYLNGEKLGRHIGGFTPFQFEVTSRLKPKTNALVVKVDNSRHADGVPTLNTDWWNYGGLTRDVKLITVPERFIRDYQIKLADYRDGSLEASVWLDGASAGDKVTLHLPELKEEHSATVNEDGLARFAFRAAGLELWSPQSPKLYELVLETADDRLRDKVGLRHIETEDKNIVLNGEPVFLRGISLHEEYAVEGGGRVTSAQQARQQLEWARQLGANFVRLAHYPHNEHIVRLADRMGLMLWSEIPVYWTINWQNPDTYDNAEQQLTEMIQRDKNRASIIIWSLANETPVSEARNEFLTRLANRARQLDNSRLLGAAMETHYAADDPELAVVEDPLAELVDIISFNQYIGWYDGLPEKISRINWHIPYNKPVFVSEFGAGAKQGFMGDPDTRWSEAFQADLYRRTLAMLERIDGLAGLSPWILADFRSPRRPLPEIQDDFNRKGLLSETGQPKAAFEVLKAYYEEKAGN